MNERRQVINLPSGVSIANAAPVGVENPVTSCDLHVLVYEAAEPAPSQRPDSRCGGRGSGACGRTLMQRSVGPVRVVVLGELA